MTFVVMRKCVARFRRQNERFRRFLRYYNTIVLNLCTNFASQLRVPLIVAHRMDGRMPAANIAIKQYNTLI